MARIYVVDSFPVIPDVTFAYLAEIDPEADATSQVILNLNVFGEVRLILFLNDSCERRDVPTSVRIPVSVPASTVFDESVTLNRPLTAPLVLLKSADTEYSSSQHPAVNAIDAPVTSISVLASVVDVSAVV